MVHDHNITQNEWRKNMVKLENRFCGATAWSLTKYVINIHHRTTANRFEILKYNTYIGDADINNKRKYGVAAEPKNICFETMQFGRHGVCLAIWVFNDYAKFTFWTKSLDWFGNEL